MPIYYVHCEENLVRGAMGSGFRTFTVEANSEEEAIKKAKSGDYSDSEFEWNDVPDTEPDEETYEAVLADE